MLQVGVRAAETPLVLPTDWPEHPVLRHTAQEFEREGRPGSQPEPLPPKECGPRAQIPGCITRARITAVEVKRGDKTPDRLLLV